MAQSSAGKSLDTPHPNGNKLPQVMGYHLLRLPAFVAVVKAFAVEMIDGEKWMGKKRKNRMTPAQLGRREREILDIVYRLEEASVADVLAAMAEPPAYDSVRTMLRLLERKGFVKHRKVGTKYVYRPTQTKSSASRSALSHLMTTFFENSLADTFAAALDLKSDDLSEEELEKLQKLIQKAKKEGR